jgi:hypothetical protein
MLGGTQAKFVAARIARGVNHWRIFFMGLGNGIIDDLVKSFELYQAMEK